MYKKRNDFPSIVVSLSHIKKRGSVFQKKQGLVLFIHVYFWRLKNIAIHLPAPCYCLFNTKPFAMKKIVSLLFILAFLYSCSDKVIRVACVGDSITEGAGLAKQSETGYPVVLNQLLGTRYAVLNCGRSATTLQKKGDFPYWTCKEFSNTFAFKPQIIVIKLGTNDTKSQNWNPTSFEQDYQALLDTFKTITPSPKIVVCLPVPVYQTEWGINDSTLQAGVLPILKKLCEKNALECIDLNSGLSNQKALFPDNIHPNEQGARKMAKIIATSILGK